MKLNYNQYFHSFIWINNWNKIFGFSFIWCYNFKFCRTMISKTFYIVFLLFFWLKLFPKSKKRYLNLLFFIFHNKILKQLKKKPSKIKTFSYFLTYFFNHFLVVLLLFFIISIVYLYIFLQSICIFIFIVGMLGFKSSWICFCSFVAAT